MIQQINLYQVKEQPEYIILSCAHMLQASVVFFVILLLVSGYMFFSQYAVQAELMKLKKQQQSLNTGLAKAQRQVFTEEDKKKITQEFQALEKARSTKEKIYFTLKQFQYNEKQGFAECLSTLAKYNMPELWLTAIKITANGNFITLEGKTTDGKYITELIQKLGHEPVFKDRTFETFRLYEDENKKLMRFTIGTEL